MRVLISGAGIAGPTLAWWLARRGMQATLIEEAPAPRTGGYIIDFWGAGYDIAGRMGLLPSIRDAGYRVGEVRAVDGDGATVAAFPADVLGAAAGGDFTSLPRGDLASVILEALDDSVERIFGDSVRTLDATGDEVRVEFERHPPRAFDLVVGADGLHSRIRELVFGPEARFERYLGIKVAAVEVDGYRPRDELVYVMYARVGQQVSRFAMRGDKTMFLFTWADDDPSLPAGPDGQAAVLRARFGDSGWECPRILDALDGAPSIYLDRVSQIEMPASPTPWSKGRVTLLGDAASCVSLLGGQGSALAMTAAYILAGELGRTPGDHAGAFARYEALFGPFVAGKQRAARGMAGLFAPPSRMSLFARNMVFRLMAFPWVARLVVSRGLTDTITLPDY